MGSRWLDSVRGLSLFHRGFLMYQGRWISSHLALALALVACSSGTDGGGSASQPTAIQGPGGSNGQAGGPTPACTPGTTQVCVGPAACDGGQSCLPDGSGYGECNCGEGGQAGASGEGGSGEGGASAGASGEGGGGEGGASAGASGKGGSGGKSQGGKGGTAGQSGGGQGGASGKAGGGGSSGGATSPCGAVPESGVCLDDHTIARCVSSTGQGQPSVVNQACPPPKVCAQVGGGEAKCFLDPSLCEPGTAKCSSSATRVDCNASGKYTESPCPSCKDSPLGPSCQVVKTTKISGSFSYEVRGPNDIYTDWGAKFTADAQGALVISFRKVGDGYEQLDVAITDDKGAYSIAVASPPGPEDVILLAAARPSSDGKSLSFAVAIPDTTDGKQDDSQQAATPTATGIWRWQASVNQVLASPGGQLLITEDIGSGALRIFDYLRYAYGYSEELMGTPGKSLVVWLRYNTDWSCGACMYNYPTGSIPSLDGIGFDSQIFIPATNQDQSYWSDAVTAHELGHWFMASYGWPAVEGGKHYLNCTTFPGQAWSEGWATGFSSLARGNSVYVDKQGGDFFWFNIGTPKASTLGLWPKPTQSGGLLQEMAENEVAALLWNLAVKPKNDPEFLGTSQVLLEALRSPRMTKAPFARGYQRHTWDVVSSGCEKTDVQTYTQSLPMVADYLDALVCSGASAGAITAALQTDQGVGKGYPYNPSSPLCP